MWEDELHEWQFLLSVSLIILVLLFASACVFPQEVEAPSPVTVLNTDLSMRCEATQVKDTWTAHCEIRQHLAPDQADHAQYRLLYDHDLVLPLPATFDEAMKAVSDFMKKGYLDELKQRGIIVQNPKQTQKKGDPENKTSTEE